jgi:transcriptional regulator with XRE-family HTH domain
MRSRHAPLASILASNVRRLRRLRGFSQIALAERSGVDRTGLNQLEGEFRGATLSTIEKLAEALAVAPWELLKTPAGIGRRLGQTAPPRAKTRLRPRQKQRRRR